MAAACATTSAFCGPLRIAAQLLRTTVGGSAVCTPAQQRLTLLTFRICVDNCTACVVDDFQLQLCLERLFVNTVDGTLSGPSPATAAFAVYVSPVCTNVLPYDDDDCCEPSTIVAAEDGLANTAFDGVTDANLLSRPIALVPGTACFVVVVRDCTLFTNTALQIYGARVQADGTTLSCPLTPPPPLLSVRAHARLRQRLRGAARCKATCRVRTHKVKKLCIVRGEPPPQTSSTVQLGAVVAFAPPLVRSFNVLFVTATAGNGGGGSGAAFTDALSFSDALAQASDGDEIWLQAGTYTATPYTVDKRVRIYGGFQALTDVARCQRDADSATNATVIDAADAGRALVVRGGATRSATLLDGVRVTRGAAVADVGGGGLYVDAAAGVTLRNVAFASNNATGGVGASGGAVAQGADSDVMACHVTLTSNSAADAGGAWFQAPSSTLTVVSGAFADNLANGAGGGGGGGALASADGATTLVNCAFSTNTAATAGGGALDAAGAAATVHVVACSFGKNFAATTGGALRVAGGAMVNVENSVFFGDVASMNDGNEVYAQDAPTSVHCVYSMLPSLAAPDVGGTGASVFGAGAVAGNPLYTNAATNDLRLQNASPAIDAGNVALLPVGIVLDLDRLPRLRDDAIDLGAYETHCAY